MDSAFFILQYVLKYLLKLKEGKDMQHFRVTAFHMTHDNNGIYRSFYEDDIEASSKYEAVHKAQDNIAKSMQRWYPKGNIYSEYNSICQYYTNGYAREIYLNIRAKPIYWRD